MTTWKNIPASITIPLSVYEGHWTNVTHGEWIDAPRVWVTEDGRQLPGIVAEELDARKIEELCDLVIEFTSNGFGEAGRTGRGTEDCTAGEREDDRKVHRVTVEGIALSDRAARLVASMFERQIAGAAECKQDAERWDAMG